MSQTGKTQAGHSPWRVPLLLFVIGLWAGAYFQQWVEYDNTRTRLYLSASLVERGVFNIDPYKDATIDISKGADGHYYSNKGIGQALLATPVHWLLRRFTPLGRHEVLNLPETYLLRLVTSTAPFAASMVLVYLLACQWGAATRHGVFVALAYGVGTTAWQHGMMFSGHILTATFSLASFYLLWQLRLRLRSKDGWDWQGLLLASAAGLFTGWGTLTDYPAVIVTGIFTLYLLALGPRWVHVVAYLAGGGIMAAILLWHNAAHFGSPFAMSYGAQDLEVFAEGSKQGIMGITLPKPWAFLQLTLLPARGVLAISPVLILAIPGAVAWWKRRDLRREWWVAMLTVVSALLWCSGFFGWHSGWAYGSRYLTPMLPFAALLLVLAPRFGWLGWLLLTVSFVQNLLAIAGCPFPPETIYNPLVEFIVPLMQRGFWALNLGLFLGLQGWLSLLPFVLILALLAAVAWRIAGNNEAPVRHDLLWRGISAGWLLVVVLMLVFVRTNPVLVHEMRAQLLGDLYKVVGDEALQQAAIAESYEAMMLKQR